ncbi:hypothetical protein FRAAL5834 [Frankia alni ACN14a]|uniref:Uncharacterized protein n=1 Tax=Frankia alni (strain DSM 45986 / CECT 9034 / ACN14a) TaxID=326424 RepID=Q0RDK2_FRAAA|nr:hypothetical protein FRAAL5834 [Frankia alni ACN14a]
MHVVLYTIPEQSIEAVQLRPLVQLGYQDSNLD